MSEEKSGAAAAGPVTGQERLVCVDTLRGVAVLGILVMNIYAFAMPFSAYENPLLMGGTDVLNLGVWFFTHIFFDQKFLSIFSMLFGAGLVMLSQRAEARGVAYGRYYFRRQFWLLLIGMLHAYLIWMGDILFVYAWVGMLAYFFRKRSPRFLITLACLLIPVSLLLSYGFAVSMEDLQVRAAEVAQVQEQGGELTEEDRQTLDDWRQTEEFISPSEESLQEDLSGYRGGYSENLIQRVPTTLMMHVAGVFFFGIWLVGALMLIGMALMKLGVLSGERSAIYYRNFMLLGYGLGLPLLVFSAFDAYAHEFEQLYMMKVGNIPNHFGSILIAFGHIGLVMLVVKAGLLRNIMSRFAAVGRMAFTNYLMHSVVMTTIFYGFGFGLYGYVPRIGQMGFVVALIALQMLLSPWWLSRFRFGPAEWLWRSLTYGQRQPMRR